MFEIPSPVFLDEDEIDRRRASERAWTAENLIDASTIAARASGSPPARINVISLPAWLAIAERAGIPHVPARLIHAFDGAVLEAESAEAFAPDEAAILAGLGPDEILRFEQVAPMEVKQERALGRPPGRGVFHSEYFGREIVFIHEERFLTTFWDLGSETIRAYARPLVAAKTVAGETREGPGAWPIEFRVFVEDGRIVGVSNYYPQIALAREAARPLVVEALRLARAMLATMDDLRLGIGNHRIAPDRDGVVHADSWVPTTWSQRSFTLDFLVREDDRVVFLEGGPAGGVAAHPCCFLQEGRVIGPDFLHGVALSLAEVLPLGDFLCATTGACD